MELYRTVSELRAVLDPARARGERIGAVEAGTMGPLEELAGSVRLLDNLGVELPEA